MQFCVFDTETTGLPTPVETPDGIKLVYPRLVQLAWVILDQNLEEIAHASFIIQPDRWTIPDDVVKIHGITTADAFLLGEPIRDVLAAFATAIADCTHIIAHNIAFDTGVLNGEYERYEIPNAILGKQQCCTMETGRGIMKIPGTDGYRRPNLARLAKHYFPNSDFIIAHDALADAQKVVRIFIRMVNTGDFTP
ncbi:MAG: exonuclease domain-containing protein [Armatimonadaceae bacterium]|jgi:DNA polymerase-3 subunit alpha